MHRIDITDLQPGDAIVFVNHYYKDDATFKTPSEDRYDGSTYEDHIAMFSHFDKSGNPVIIHSVLSEDPTKPSGLIKSTLQPLLNKSDTFTITNDEGEEVRITRRFDVTFKVFRYEETELANKAVTLLNIWHDYDIPYDEARLNAKIALENNGYEAEDFYKLATSQYETIGKFRALKYAVRRAEALTQSSLHGKGHGLTCSMTYILAFQIAELDNNIYTLKEINERFSIGQTKLYNSDKHATYNANELPESYVNYLEAIQNKNVLKQPYYVTSLQFCRPGFNIHSFTHKSFPVNAKCIGVAGIVYLFNHSSNWKELGTLELGAAKPFTDEQKVFYRKYREAIKRKKEKQKLLFELQGHYGSALGENQAKFQRELRVIRPEPVESKSEKSSPQKTVRTTVPATDPQRYSNKPHSSTLFTDVSRRLSFVESSMQSEKDKTQKQSPH